MVGVQVKFKLDGIKISLSPCLQICGKIIQIKKIVILWKRKSILITNFFKDK